MGSRFRVKLSDNLLRKLQQLRAKQSRGFGWEQQEQIEDEHNAFLIDLGMGPMTYLTSDGRILYDMDSWDCPESGIHEASEDEAIGSLVVGAKKTHLLELLDLIPPPPEHSSICSQCSGSRWASPVPGFEMTVVCTRCHGRGWTTHDA